MLNVDQSITSKLKSQKKGKRQHFSSLRWNLLQLLCHSWKSGKVAVESITLLALCKRQFLKPYTRKLKSRRQHCTSNQTGCLCYWICVSISNDSVLLGFSSLTRTFYETTKYCKSVWLFTVYLTLNIRWMKTICLQYLPRLCDAFVWPILKLCLNQHC